MPPFASKVAKSKTRTCKSKFQPRLLRLENRITPILGQAGFPFVVDPYVGVGADNLAGVVDYDSDCTGSLLDRGIAVIGSRHVLTAAHCAPAVGDIVNFYMAASPNGVPDGTLKRIQVTVEDVWVHPTWTGNTADLKGDIAVVTLSNIAPFGASDYEIYTQAQAAANSELGRAFLMAGYGFTGDGTVGQVILPEEEYQRLTVNAVGGSYRLGLDGNFTGNLAFNANAAQIETALEAVPGVGTLTVRNVTVGPHAGSVEIRFDSSTTDFNQLTVDTSALTGTANVRTAQNGGRRAFRIGQNTYDSFAGDTIVSDFDNNGTDTFEGQGDSGGPGFLDLGGGNLAIASVVSRGGFKFGDTENNTRVSKFSNDVTAVINAGPYDLVVDMADQVDGDNGTADVIEVRIVGGDLQVIVNNNLVYSDASASISSVTIIGSTDDDHLTVRSESLTQPVTFVGGDGSDSLDVLGSNAADKIQVFDDHVTVNALQVDYDATLEFLTVDGRAGNDDFTVVSTAVGVDNTILGSADNDQFLVTDAAFKLDEIQGVVALDGGLGDNTVAFNDTGSTTDNVYFVEATALGRFGIAQVTFISMFDFRLFGGNGGNLYLVSGTGGTALNLITDQAGDSVFSVAGDGLTGQNRFFAGDGIDEVSIFANSGITGTLIVVQGDGQSQFFRDVLNFFGRPIDDAMTLAYLEGAANKGAGAFLTGLGQRVDFDTFEQVNIDGEGGSNNHLTVIDGTSLAMGGADLLQTNSIIYRPTGQEAGDLRFNGVVDILINSIVSKTPSITPFTTFTDITGDFTINGGKFDDTLVVLGVSEFGLQDIIFQETQAFEGEDTITVSDSQVTIVNQDVGSRLGVNIVTSSFTNVVVRAGNEAPPVGDDVTVTPSNQLNIFLDGMDPKCGTPGDRLTINTIGSRTVFRQVGGDENKGPDGHVRVRDDANLAEVGFINFETAVGLGIVVIGSDAGAPAIVQVRDATTGLPRLTDFDAFPGFFGGVRVAAGDLTGDGIADIVVAAGPGGGSHVRAFDGIDGAPLADFFAYADDFHGGVNVAVGDTQCDGSADIITAPASNGGPHIKMFDNAGALFNEFFAYAPSFTGGVNVAAGDIDGDGGADIVTGAGEGGGPHVVAYRGSDLSILRNFFAYSESFRGGVFVAVGDVDGDFESEIITGAGNGGGPHLRIFSMTGLSSTGILHEFFVNEPFAPGQLPQIPRETGLRVAVADVDGDGILDVITGKGPGTRPTVRAFHIPLFLGEAVRADVFSTTTYGQGIFVGGSR